MAVKQKKMTKSAGVTIPKDLRGLLGIFPGQALDLEVVGDALHIKKHVPTCHFCGSPTDVVSSAGRDLCRNCISGFSKAGTKTEA